MSVTLTLTDPGYPQGQVEQNGSHNSSRSDDSQEGLDARESKVVTFDNTTQGLGLKIFGGWGANGNENFGIFIKRVLPGGLAEAKGYEVYNGDQILEVNGQSMEGITYDRAVSILRQASASNHVKMILTRDEESRRELEECQARHIPTNNGRNDSHISNNINNDSIGVSRKANISKGTSHDSTDAFDQSDLNLNLSGLSSNSINGTASPTSNEVASHLVDNHSYPPPPLALPNNPNLRTTTPSLDSLDTLLSRKLLKDPGLRLPVDQLEAAVVKLGLDLSPRKHQLVRERLTVDHEGMVRFEEFAKVIRSLFRNEMDVLKGRTTPLSLSAQQVQGAGVVGLGLEGPVSLEEVVKERDDLKAEVAALREELTARNQACKHSEDQLLFIRKQTQTVIEEGRSVRTKLHLAEQAQTRAQQTERDYEEVVAMLENEVAQLRLQGTKTDTLSMQKRLAVLVCQLKKAESGLKTYEVATEKLVKHIEHSVEVVASVDKSPWLGDVSKGKAVRKKALANLGVEGRDVIKVVRSLMETVALPFGWEEAYTSEGVRYYINHLNQTTTWTHPVSCMEHQTSATKTAPAPQQHQQQQQQQTQQDVQAQQGPPPPPESSSTRPLQPPPAPPGYGTHPPQQDSSALPLPQPQQPQPPHRQQQQHQQHQQHSQEKQKKNDHKRHSQEPSKHSPSSGTHNYQSALI